jgi:hypothetical protein
MYGMKCLTFPYKYYQGKQVLIQVVEPFQVFRQVGSQLEAVDTT